ncbi:hypothetical protein [Methylibium sp.]|uniref:hypothetical protein n=1 Tax=Methylibium sp. TaxID=2067992 RepID=UPI0017904C74|nr:hypothetical protein [Methylibium sp.]MBA3588488.1 hypothetical protein [Methylibium sp.]
MTDQPSSNPGEFDPAAVEAVAKAIEHMLDNFPGANDEYIRDVASAAIAALSAIGWVEGQRHAIVCDACETLTATYVAITRERDALRAALELIAAPVRADGTYNRCREACEVVARDAIAAAKDTP